MVMDKNFIVITLLALSILAKAQSPYESKTYIFANQPGAVIEKEYHELGYLDQIDVRLMKMKNLITNQTAYGIRFEFLPGNEIITNAKIGYLDSDEIGDLIKSIAIIQNRVVTRNQNIQSEVTFLCRSGLVIGCFFDVNKKNWIPYIQIIQSDPNSTVRLEKNGFNYLLKMLEDANIKAK